MLKTVTNTVNVGQITGVLPVVNGGTGVTTSTGTGSTVLSAAPTLSGNVTFSTGSLIVASGQGVDFSATPGTGTSELFDDYEEGTFTPTISQGFTAPVGYTVRTGVYTKVGDLVYFHIYIFMDAGQTRNADALAVGGLPFAAASGIINGCSWGYASGVVVAGTALPNLYLGGTAGIFYNTGGAPFTGLNLTSARPEIAISGVYKTT